MAMGMGATAGARTLAESAPKAPAGATASAGGTVELKAALSHAYVPAKAAKSIHARIQLRADDVQAEARAPMNLAVVIDHSGSMSGGRLVQAKAAAHSLVDRLSEQDRLAVVSYGSRVTVNMDSVAVTPANRELLHAAINSIKLHGSTNLEGGYLKGAGIVGQHPTDSSVNRVILLSDGHANIGARTPEALGKLAGEQLEKGISVSAMGIGLDYNEKLMAEMAAQGAGNYYFVEDEKKLAEIFKIEFKTLSNVVARNAKVEITVGPGVELIKVHGFAHEMHGDKAVINLGAFYARQQKDILVDLAVSARGEAKRDILKVRLAFDDVTKNDKSVFSLAKLAATATEDAAQLAQVNDAVMRRVEQIVYATNVARANDAFEKGRKKEAQKILDAQQNRLTTRAKFYGFSDTKIAEKVDQLEEQKKKMAGTAAPSAAPAKRLRKASRQEANAVMLSADAF
jgi:Ca-activated chloride channel family protein